MPNKGKYVKTQKKKKGLSSRGRKSRTSQSLQPVFAIGLIVLSILSFLYFLPIDDNTVTQRGSSEPYPELDPDENPTNISKEEAIDIFLNSSVTKELWREPTQYWNDPEDNDTGASTPPSEKTYIRLIQDNVRSYIRWEVVNFTVIIWIDAETGEIIHYSNFDFVEGNITEAEAVSLSQQYANKFAQMPVEAVLFNVTKFSPNTNVILNPNNSSEVITGEVYSIIFSRMKNSVPSDDGIYVWISTSGQLVLYDKVWTLIMPESTTPQISEDDAIAIAKSVFNGTVDRVTLMIKRPNFYWDGGEYMYGFNEGKLCYVVELTNAFDRRASVWVDALNGEVVGGWETI